MTKNSYPTRTTLWDEELPADSPAPQPRGPWRAPSAVLSDRSRRPVSAIPPINSASSTEEDDFDAPSVRVPRRTKFAAARTPWWRPRTTFGQILLGSCAFLGIAFVVSAGIITRNYVTRDPHFRIPGATSIQSSGLAEVNRTEILPVFGEDIGRNIFFVPLNQRRKQIESIPWVQQATVMRYLPNRISVSIVERTPVAFVRVGNQVELADADGVILNMPPVMMAQHHYSFPVITGIDANATPAARRTRMAVYQRFVAELDRGNQHLTEQVSEIDLSDPEDLRATMPTQGSDVLAHFGEDHFLSRWETYQQHVSEWRSRYPHLIGVDLRYNGEIPLEMSPDTDAAPAKPAAIPAATAIPKPSATAATPKAVATASTATAVATKPAQSKAAQTKPAQAAPTHKAAPKSIEQRAAEARKRTEKLKAARAKAARLKAAHAKAAHQGQ